MIVYSFTRRIKKAARAVRKKESEIVSVIHESLAAVRVIRAFAREDYEQRRLEVESMESVMMSLKARGLKARLSPIVEVIVAIGTALVLWFGARMVLEGTLSAGSLIVFVLYLGKMYKPMQELSKMTDSYSKAAVAFERIREVLDIETNQGSARRRPRAAAPGRSGIRERRLLLRSQSPGARRTSAFTSSRARWRPSSDPQAPANPPSSA